MRTLMARLDGCSAALCAYHQRRVGDVLQGEACRREAIDEKVEAWRRAAIDAGLLEDDIF